MIETILIVLFSILATSFAFMFYIQKNKNAELIAKTMEFLVFQEEQFKQSKTEREQFNEDFLKFVSDSRDVAYTYIQELQTSLDSFISIVDPEIEYFEEYGVLWEPYPGYNSLKKIAEAYKDLKNIMPDDYGKIDI